MADEDIESGGQTDDSDAGDEEPEADAGDEGGGERQAARLDDVADKPKTPRNKRRADAMREAAIAREAAVRENAELKQRVQAAEAAAQEAHRRIEERERQSQTSNQAAQAKERIAAIRRQAKTQLAMSAQAKDPAQAEKYWDEFQRLNDEADDLRDELRDADRWEKRKGEIAGSLPNQGLIEEKQYFQAKYPWVATNVEGRSLADGRFAALVQAGRPPTRQTMEEAITYAAKILRLGGNGTQNPASRNAYVGMGQRDGEGDGGGTGGSMTADDVKNNLALKRMALQIYNNLDEQQAYAKFAKEIGTKALRAD
jgi:hypothetical protein